MVAKSKSAAYFRVLGCYYPYSLLVLLAMGFVEKSLWLISPLIFLFVVTPLLDAGFKKDYSTFEQGELSPLQTRICRFSPYGFIFGYVSILALFISNVNNFTALELTLAIISVGAVGSINMTASHELIHKKSTFAKLSAQIGLLSIINLHFEYSHLHGHHREAGTLQDNHTARLGETFPNYLIRTTKGALKFVCEFENTRLNRIGMPWINIQNKILLFFGLPILVIVAISILVGPLGLVFFVGQSVIAVISLEAVAYIEHYGLMRELKNGKLKPMQNRHSWDSYHRFSNYMTFMLQRHADHHLNSSKDYFLLRSNSEAPELPMGYPLLILIVNLPKRWFKMVHPIAGLDKPQVNSPSSEIHEFRWNQ